MSIGKKTKRSVCPVSCSLDILGDKWTLLIVRDLFLGKQHFKEFLQSPEKIATNILSNRLERLLTNELIRQVNSDLYPGRKSYVLTGKGKRLLPVVKAIRDWGLENIEGTEVKLTKVKLTKARMTK